MMPKKKKKKEKEERRKKKKKKEMRETYFKLGLIKQYRMGGRRILLMLRLKKKTEDKNKEVSQQVYGVSYGKSPIKKMKKR